MTSKGGSSGGSSSSSSSGSDKKDKERVNAINPVNNLTGSLSSGGTSTGRDAPSAHGGKSDGDDGKAVINIRPADTSIVGGASSVPDAHLGSENGGAPGVGRKGDAIDTTVTQRPTPSTPIPPAVDGSENTVVTNGPRSDFSVVLAGQVGRRPERSAARSLNFTSLVGGAGGLGRRTSQARRSLIGGA